MKMMKAGAVVLLGLVLAVSAGMAEDGGEAGRTNPDYTARDAAVWVRDGARWVKLRAIGSGDGPPRVRALDLSDEPDAGRANPDYTVRDTAVWVRDGARWVKSWTIGSGDGPPRVKALDLSDEPKVGPLPSTAPAGQ